MTWGRWGEEDQRGALNHVGPQQMNVAGGLVWQRKVISVGLPLDPHGPHSSGFPVNPLNIRTATSTDDLAGKQITLPGGFRPEDGVYEFMLFAAPLPITGGGGLPAAYRGGNVGLAVPARPVYRAGPTSGAAHREHRGVCAGGERTWQ